MSWWMFAKITVALLSLVLLLYTANEPRKSRYRQRIIPLYALTLYVAVLLLHWFQFDIIRQYLHSAFIFLGWNIALSPETGLPEDLIVLNFSILCTFIACKYLHLSLTRLLDRLLDRKTDTFKENPRKITLFPAYVFSHERGISLHDNWVYPGRYLRCLSALSLLVLIGWLGCMVYDPNLLNNLIYADLPILPILLFLELGWYLGGKDSVINEESLSNVTSISSEQRGYSKLWAIYNRTCTNRILASSPNWSSDENITASHHPRADGKRDVDRLLQLIENNFSKNNLEQLEGQQRNALLDGLHNKDLQLIEPTFRLAIPIVFSLLQRDILLGHHILILVPAHLDQVGREEAEHWVKEGLSNLFFTRIDSAVSQGDFSQTPVVMATLNELLNHTVDIDPWLESLARVVVLDTTQVFHTDIVRASQCCDLLHDRCVQMPAYLLLTTGDRGNLESSLRDFLGVCPEEYLLHRHTHPKISYHIWQSEGTPTFQNQTLQLSGGRLLGSEIALAVPAMKEGFDHVMFCGITDSAWKENLEELDKALSGYEARDSVHICHFPCVHPTTTHSVVIASDSCSNLIHTMRTGMDLGSVETMLLSVSPQYLLRDYLVSHLDFFLHTDGLTSFILTPRPLASVYSTAIRLFGRLRNSAVHESNIIMSLKAIALNVEEEGVRNCLSNLFLRVFHVDFIANNLLFEEHKYRFDSEKNQFTEERLYRIASNVQEHVHIPSQDYYRLIDNSGKVLKLVPGDQVYQRYLPGQVHAVAGEPFCINSIDEKELTVHVTHTNQSIGQYRPVQTVTIEDPFEKDVLQLEKVKAINGYRVLSETWDVRLIVQTHGYHEFHNGWLHHSYTPLETSQTEHHYPGGRMLLLHISCATYDSIELGRISQTFALLLREMLPTIFPENHRSLLISTTALFNKAHSPHDWHKTRNPFDLLPAVNAPRLLTDFSEKEPGITIIFVEDAFLDQGMIQPIKEQWLAIFSLVEDHLRWFLDGQDSENTPPYLNFGGEGLHPDLRFQELLELLSALLAGNGESIQQQRTRYFEHYARPVP